MSEWLLDLIVEAHYSPVTEIIYKYLSIVDICNCLSTCAYGMQLKRDNQEIQWLMEKRKCYKGEYWNETKCLVIPFHASIFEEACFNGYLQAVKWLLPFCYGVVSLQLGLSSALKGGQLRVAKFLYSTGALGRDICIYDIGQTVEINNFSCLDWILQVCVNHENDQTRSYLSILLALGNGNQSFCEKLISHFHPSKDQLERMHFYTQLLESLASRDPLVRINSIQILNGLTWHERDHIIYSLFRYKADLDTCELCLQDMSNGQDLYLITTAMSRRSEEWVQKINNLVFSFCSGNPDRISSVIYSLMQENNIDVFFKYHAKELRGAMCSGRVWFVNYFRDIKLPRTLATPFYLDRHFFAIIESRMQEVWNDGARLYFVFGYFLDSNVLVVMYRPYIIYFLEGLEIQDTEKALHILLDLFKNHLKELHLIARERIYSQLATRLSRELNKIFQT